MRVSRTVPAVLVTVATTPLALRAQAGEHGASGAGGGLFDINTGLSTWTLLVFAGLLFLLGKFAWGPILAAVEAREKNIQGALDEAAARNEEARKLLDEHRQQLADARRQASDLVAEGKAAGERLRREIEEKARVEGQSMVERARQEIEREKEAALDTLRKEAVELALAAASRLLHENLTQEKDRELVERFLDGVSEGEGVRA